MAGVRKALIVATDQYTDPKLTRLNAPAEDARALAEVLRDPDVGAYDVQTVLNKTCQEVEIAIASFFQSGARDDTLLVHFSCHGVKDISGELYFATTDTKLPLLKVTGVSSSMVKQAMEESRASLILCLVDCCYSGAFTKSTKAAATVDLTERLGGRGRAVITASTSLQLALDGQHQASLFTHAVVEGLQSGEADRDLDGLVTLDEFYNYVHEKVTAANPDQTPVKSFDVQGEVYVARRGTPITTPAALPRELVDTVADGEDWQRLGAVSRLTDLLNAGHPGRALAARLALEKVRDNDDSIKVRKMAEAALEDAGDTEAIPLIPAYVEGAPAAMAVDSSDTEEFATAGAKGGPLPSGDSAVEDAAVEDTAIEEPVVTQGTPETQPRPVFDPGGAGGGPAGGSGSGPPRKRGRWTWVLVGSGAILGILVVLYLIGLTVDDGEGNKADPGAGPDAPGLAESELLVPVQKNGTRVLEAVDVDSDSFTHRDLVDEADLPSLSKDRLWMWYIRDVSFGDLKGRVAYGAEVDPVHKVRLLDKFALESCPSSSRPAESRSGGWVALVCREASYDGNTGSSRGLFYAGLDGHRIDSAGLVPVIEDSRVVEAPTWTGDDKIIFVADEWGPGGQSALLQTSMSGGEEPVEITDGTEGWDSSPDWSDEGVLFLRRPSAESKTGDVWVVDQDGPRQLTEDVEARWPTWSPDGTRFAYLVVEGAGVRSLWVQGIEPGAEPRQITLDGNPGPPVWSES